MSSAWLTPEAAAGGNLCRRLSIPVELVPAVTGALDQLTNAAAWETYGSMTPDEAAALCAAMVEEYLQSDGACMIGSIVSGAWENMPANLLACDGATYQRDDYPLLYDVIDTYYHIDSDTFSVPDLRSRMVVGAGQGAGLSAYDTGDYGGTETVTLEVNQLPSHTHSVLQPGINVDVEPPAGVPDIAGGLPEIAQTGSEGSDDPHDNMPPFYALQYAIVAR